MEMTGAVIKPLLVLKKTIWAQSDTIHSLQVPKTPNSVHAGDHNSLNCSLGIT